MESGHVVVVGGALARVPAGFEDEHGVSGFGEAGCTSPAGAGADDV
jgi:hypothetical protein